ncbi:phosphoribosyl-AMP cyclohydrolase [Victivallis vadensis]|uniref:Phosphoribosyl-AMP cyclohydrolase n=1 Tax=Victivallis vadensis TaxID=172901 RepID=A0A848B0A8_9BACT|nr:phosphoribosyl-AMP cyclohydrolase [Victivallis vadensis]NMD87687.1 phosphoribosyl-AMP cyclohydrolase [Victivallis vadensis]
MIELDFSKYGGLIPAIAQDFRTGEVLMLANINPESWQETLATGCAVYYSRSRKRLWRKGEESGNVQLIREILVDCDGDSVIFKVEQIGGAACHTGHRSCFYRKVDGGTLVETGETVFDPKKVYNKQ